MATLNKLKKTLKDKKIKWLVTGVAGFIGSNLAEFLLSCNQKVIGLDNFSTGNKKNIEVLKKKFKKKFKFVKGDIKNINTCEKITKKIDVVLHNAALGSVPRSIKNPISTHESNSTGFLNILYASKKNKVKNFIFASSSSVYGNISSKFKNENFLGSPLSPYAVTKRENEEYAKVFSRIYNMNIVALRYFNVFGKNQSSNSVYAAVIPKWIKLLKNKKPITIFGDGNTTRDYCFVDNVIQANVLAAISKKNFSYQVFNVAVGKETSLDNLCLKIAKYFNIKKKIRIIYKKTRQGDIKRSVASINKIKNNLKYTPEFDIDRGLQKLNTQI